MFRFVRRRLGRKVVLFAGASALLAAALGNWASGAAFASVESLILLSSVLAGVLSTLVALRLFVLAPLSRLRRTMTRAAQGDFLVRAKVESDDELGELARSFNRTVAEITDMSVFRIDAERELALKAEVEARRKELELLFEVTRVLPASLEVDEVLRRITEKLVDPLSFDEFVVLLYEEGSHEYVIQQAYGFDEDEVVGERFRDDEGVISMVHATRERVYLPDTSKEPRYLHYKGHHKADGSLLVVPLSYGDRMVGALSFTRPGVDAFSPDEIRLIATLSGQAALALVNARLYQETVELSLIDPLTQAFNRRHLHARLGGELDRARRFGHELVVIMIDIDHFKQYNDAHGHPMGDRVLRVVAATLASQLRRVDTLARYGGEEFTVLLPRSDAAHGVEVAEKLRRAIEEIDFPGGHTQPSGRVTLSLGVAVFPEHGGDGAEVLDRADSALYEAKNGGRNQVHLFDGASSAA